MRSFGLLSASFLLVPAIFSQGGDVASTNPEPTSAKPSFTREVRPFLEKYCISCHGGKRPKGDLSFENIKDDAAADKQRELWERVVQAVRSGEMPPKGKPRPAAKEVAFITGWLETHLARVDCKGPRDPGRVTIRRLNRAEYNNTIRDLLGVDFKPAADFPSDDVGYGFDNIGDVLTLSPLLLEKYLAAAEKAVELAFAKPATRDTIMTRPPGKVRRSEAARFILRNTAKRAYRRPVTDDEVLRLARLVELAEQNGQTFDQGVQLALKAMLCSPHFLFRVEQDRGTKPGEVQPISEHELACRLSYFLWSSMPDDELFCLADAGYLRHELEAQVKRMLKDAKVRALTENFAGQWLQLRSLDQAQPDPKLFPSFNSNLRTAMRKETELFFEAVVKEDRSVLDFLDGDFTFVNETLATHYGIPRVTGKDFVRVKLDPSQRGGVLTHASILTVTSNPTRTSLVKRGKFILENILGTPPPPPDPDAGELPDDNSELKGTLRQRIELHRANPACAVCHQRMDPLGFALENFDAVGKWRTHEGKFPIDASGSLPGGQTFNGPQEMRAVLKGKSGEFRKCFTEKMVTYALGRGLEYYDRCAVDDIVKLVAANENRFSSLVLAVVKSEPFQLRKSKGERSGS